MTDQDNFIKFDPKVHGTIQLSALTSDDLPVQTVDWFTASDFNGMQVQERSWLIPEKIMMGTVATLSGEGGTGKSLLAMQLVFAVVTDGTWIGEKVIKGPALYYSAEDDPPELHRRLLDIASSQGMPLNSLDQLHIAPMSESDSLLMIADNSSLLLKPTALMFELERKIAEIRPALVVLDSRADVFGGDEIKRAQVRQFLSWLRRIASQYNCAILMLDHPSVAGSKDGRGTSGSTAWSNSVRSRMWLKKVEGESDIRSLTVEKSNYGPVGAEFKVRWQNGVFVLVSASKPDRLSKVLAEKEADEKFLELLDKFEAEGRGNVSDKPGANFAPSVFDRHPHADGIKKLGFAAAMNRLLASGIIKLITVGPKSRERNKLVRLSPEVNQ